MKNRLKVLRTERNWTQSDLAKALDVSRQTINAIETGKFDPSLPLAFRAAKVFGLTIEQIFDDSEHWSALDLSACLADYEKLWLSHCFVKNEQTVFLKQALLPISSLFISIAFLATGYGMLMT